MSTKSSTTNTTPSAVVTLKLPCNQSGSLVVAEWEEVRGRELVGWREAFPGVGGDALAFFLDCEAAGCRARFAEGAMVKFGGRRAVGDKRRRVDEREQRSGWSW